MSSKIFSRFCNIVVSHQAVPFTFYNKITLMTPVIVIQFA